MPQNLILTETQPQNRAIYFGNENIINYFLVHAIEHFLHPNAIFYREK